MTGLKYQLKSVLRDKFCLMTFLLPILVAVALNFMGSIDLSSLGELHFGVLENDLSPQTVTWLEQYGPVTAYGTQEELVAAINEPSTNVIGVKADGNRIKTAISGDELDIFRQAAATLPALYEQREHAGQTEVQVLERSDILENFQGIFIPAVLIVAMFMGCTFNAMNIISEKEDGVAFINEILPMSPSQYIFQKVVVGFLFGSLSSIVTACICFRLSWQNFGVMLALIVLSSFVAALIGLFIGRLSEGLMIGVVYIKIVMLVFIAVPIVCALIGVSGPLAIIYNIVPSHPAFDGIMALTTEDMGTAIKDVGILAVHCIAWFMLYSLSSAHCKRRAIHEPEKCLICGGKNPSP
ncbi:MAG: ABC transporter permease [Oscillospiraceae bacterium]|nr:ABC transporter permease [Oscillospiraceae bacterium]